MLRRLRRLCEHYGSDPTFFFASATIGNPGELASALCGLASSRSTTTGRRASERVLACWQRPLLDAHSGARASANIETAELLDPLRADGHQTLAFTRSRRGAEVVAQYARRRLAGAAPELADRVAAYRAGYLPEERRALELDLTSGRLLGIAATNALELGIDIGGLDAVVLNGFPGTLASMWQQAGRAGRTGRRSAAVLVAGDDQLDQWYAAHPTELDPAARPSARSSTRRTRSSCARRSRARRTSCRSPPTTSAGSAPGSTTRCASSCTPTCSRRAAGSMYWSGGRAPARDVGLRSGSSIEYRLVDVESERTIGTVDDARVFSVAHPGAVYLHQGRQYRVDRLDRDEHVAMLEPYDDADEYTQARTDDRHHDRQRGRSSRRSARRSCTSARSRSAAR